jgi:hypothetical protein
MPNATAGNFVWYELYASDPETAVDFYTHVMGWTTQPFGDAYTMWVGSQGPLGGTVKLPPEAVKSGAPPNWVGSVLVEDLDACMQRVGALGGRVTHGPETIPDVGRLAVVCDPQGAFLNVFQPNGTMERHDSSRPGGFCWRELMTSDRSGAFAFYSELFGWRQLDEMDMGPMGTYLLFGFGDAQGERVGGMMKVPPEMPMPPMWLYYTEVDDLEAATRRAEGRGATVLQGPMDVPGGRVTQLRDPQGALFSLHQLRAQ